jgi:TRAP-type C4-dicarboxylate transport system permease small subunit
MSPSILKLEVIVNRVCLVCSRIAGSILTFLALLLVVDAIGRLMNHPITGSYETVQYGFALVVCLSVAYTAVEKGHIAIDLVFICFPQCIQRVLQIVSQLFSIVIFALITWRLSGDAFESYKLAERSSTLGLPVYLFGFALAFGFAMLGLVIFLDLVKLLGIKK